MFVFQNFWLRSAGQLKNILTTVLSILVLEGGSTSFTGAIGLSISICGSIVYSYVKYKESQLKKQTYQALPLAEVPKAKSPKIIVSAWIQILFVFSKMRVGAGRYIGLLSGSTHMVTWGMAFLKDGLFFILFFYLFF